jgi:Tfp pilus assembly protein FimV
MKLKDCALLLIAGLLAVAAIVPAHADSKRVYVYPITRQYWDVRTGETLAYIADALLPGKSRHQQQLIQDILQLNPGAFIDSDPDRLLANTRLWLPNTITRPISAQRNAEIHQFDWGYIKRTE